VCIFQERAPGGAREGLHLNPHGRRSRRQLDGKEDACRSTLWIRRRIRGGRGWAADRLPAGGLYAWPTGRPHASAVAPAPALPRPRLPIVCGFAIFDQQQNQLFSPEPWRRYMGTAVFVAAAGGCGGSAGCRGSCPRQRTSYTAPTTALARAAPRAGTAFQTSCCCQPRRHRYCCSCSGGGAQKAIRPAV